MTEFEHVPGKCGGDPVIKGTRLPAWAIIPMLDETNETIRYVYPDATDAALNELREEQDTP